MGEYRNSDPTSGGAELASELRNIACDGMVQEQYKELLNAAHETQRPHYKGWQKARHWPQRTPNKYYCAVAISAAGVSPGKISAKIGFRPLKKNSTAITITISPIKRNKILLPVSPNIFDKVAEAYKTI